MSETKFDLWKIEMLDDRIHPLPDGSKFAAGPWHLCAHLRDNDKCSCGYRGGIWDASGEVMICEMGASAERDGTKIIPEFDRPTTQANARLIAASPDLYAALKDLMFLVDHDDPWGKEHVQAWNAAAKSARSALSRARGESTT